MTQRDYWAIPYFETGRKKVTQECCKALKKNSGYAIIICFYIGKEEEVPKTLV